MTASSGKPGRLTSSEGEIVTSQFEKWMNPQCLAKGYDYDVLTKRVPKGTSIKLNNGTTIVSDVDYCVFEGPCFFNNNGVCGYRMYMNNLSNRDSRKRSI